MKKTTILYLLFISILSCNLDHDTTDPIHENSSFITAVDISGFPEIELSNPTFYDTDGKQEAFLTILKESGVTTIRLRLWVNPSNEHSGFNEVKIFADRLRQVGFKIWLTIHYSDTWADPGHQEIPEQWRGNTFSELKNNVRTYTRMIMEQIQPDYVQIGNEINSGFLFPSGSLTDTPSQFKELISVAIDVVRSISADSKIIIHIAGIDGADWFFEQVNSLDYDIMGISYYPIWHGKDLRVLQSKMDYLSQRYKKDWVIAETAYPFTLDWNDWTNNIVGTEEQLILPDYPATALGQQKFVHSIKTIVQDTEKGIGFCYWGAELIAWKGNQSTDASPWENQALFDFNNRALLVLKEFKAQ